MCATGGYVWNKALIAFDGFDFRTLESVPTGEKDSKGKDIKELKVKDPVTGKISDVPNFDLQAVQRLMWIGLIGGFGVAMIVIFTPKSARILSPVYAALEGLALGGVSAIYEVQFQGITMQAMAATVVVMFVMLAIFSTGLIKVTPMMTAVVLALMLGVLGLYLVDIVLQSFFGTKMEIVHGTGTGAIALNVAICALAAWNFFIDFDTIEKGVESGAPKYMEAYCAFGVLLTLVWLYLEILRLLAKLKKKD